MISVCFSAWRSICIKKANLLLWFGSERLEMPALHLKHSLLLKDRDGVCGVTGTGVPAMAAGSHAVPGAAQVGLCSGQAGVPALAGTSTCACTAFERVLGSFSSLRLLSSSCKLCRLLVPTAPGALSHLDKSIRPDGCGEMYGGHKLAVGTN